MMEVSNMYVNPFAFGIFIGVISTIIIEAIILAICVRRGGGND